ncbi:MAG: hypothetical protein WDO70_06030 [Alphaproteobacteria bacterium]
MSKRKGRKGITGLRTWATPTKERRRQNGGVICDTIQSSTRIGLIRRYRAVWECPLDAYHAHGVIRWAEYRAGLRLHRAYHGVVLCRRADYRPMSDEHASWPQTRIEKLLNLARKIIMPEDLNTVIDICGHSRPAQFQRELVSLKRGLGDLASRWHMAAAEACEHKNQ